MDENFIFTCSTNTRRCLIFLWSIYGYEILSIKVVLNVGGKRRQVMAFYQGTRLHFEAYTRRKAVNVCAQTLKLQLFERRSFILRQSPYTRLCLDVIFFFVSFLAVNFPNFDVNLLKNFIVPQDSNYYR